MIGDSASSNESQGTIQSRVLYCWPINRRYTIPDTYCVSTKRYDSIDGSIVKIDLIILKVD